MKKDTIESILNIKIIDSIDLNNQTLIYLLKNYLTEKK